MSKINQIEQELSQIDASKFHKLINTYLSKKFSFMIHSNGTKIGEDKPISGTPDSFVALEDGNYIFVECTTQKSDIVSKFSKDLEKCFDEAKTGISISKINKIILACNSDIKPNEIESLKEYCRSKDIDLCFIGISSLANDLYVNYSKIAYGFLGVSVDTMQILDESDFVAEYESGGYATPLNTVLCCRDKEVADIELALKDSQITFITGKAGVGKTRLAIEVAPKFAKENGYKFKAIFNRGVNIYDDLMAYFNVKDEKFLIFIDDVNRIHQALGYLLNSFVKKISNSKIKIVATVRDYAKDIIEKVPSNISCSVIEIQSMHNISVSEIISKNFKNINPIHNEKILEISQNNPRMAFMACKIAQNGSFDAVNNTYDLYKEYFKSADNDINIFGDIDIGKIVAITAFFRVIDRQNDKQVEVIKQAFEVDIVAIWDKIEKLHRYEIFDMYENNVIKVSDQILASYLFYKTVFVDKNLKINSFIVNFFPNHSGKIRDVLNQIVPVFDINLILKELKDPVDRLWLEYSDKSLLVGHDDNPIIEFVEIFWYLKESEILEKLHEEIQDLEQEHIDVNTIDIFKSSDNKSDTILYILSLLSRSNDENNLKIAIDLIVMYLNKKPNKIYEVIDALVKEFGYELDSYMDEYKKKIVMSKLWELSKNSDTLLLGRLFIRIASEMLGTDFQDTRHHGRTLNLYNYTLVPTQALINFRKTIFERLDEIFKSSYFLVDLEKFINAYSQKTNISNRKDILEQDSKYMLDLTVKYFNPKIYKHCKIVRDFLSFLDGNKIPYDKNVQTIFKHGYFGIYDLLWLNPCKLEGDNIEQNNAYIKNELIKFANNHKTKGEWLELFNACVEIYNVIDDINPYRFRSNFGILLEILSSNDSQLFIEVLGEYFKLGDPFLLYLDRHILIKILGKNGAFEFIEKQNFKAKDFWRFGIFAAIDENDITQTDVKNLLDLYKSADIANIPQYFDYLQKYENIRDDIVLEVLRVLYNRNDSNEISKVIYFFFIFFNSSLDKYIAPDKDLMEVVYLSCLKSNRYFDYNAKILDKLLNYDPSFINRYTTSILDTFINNACSIDIHMDYSILFNRSDYEEIFLKIIELFYSMPREYFVFREIEFLKSFFMRLQRPPLLNTEKTISIIEQFIDKYFTDKERMIFISRLICEFNSDESENANIDTRAHLYAYIISKNNDYELFKSLKFEKNLRMSHGSWVPVIQRDIEFYEKLMSAMDTVSLLRHRTFVEDIISTLKRRIALEKKFDFMEDERFCRYENLVNNI